MTLLPDRCAFHLLAPCALLALVASPARALDEVALSRVLERYTKTAADTAGTRVRYAALAGAPEWRSLVASLERSDPDAPRSRAEKLAFWINAYNVLAIATVVTAYPVQSIRDVGSFFRPVWGRTAGRIGGKPFSLEQIEHEILRPMGEPRVHAAIVCASTSCPSLRREPYRARDLEAQLDDAMRQFVTAPTKGARLDRAAGTLTVSKIFDWFEEDFTPPGVVPYLLPYLPDADAAWLRPRIGEVDVEFFDYDWTLNDAR